jgi:hypothetical protein
MKLALAVTLTLISAPACAQWQYAQPWPQPYWPQFDQPAVRHHQPRREQSRLEPHKRKAEVHQPVVHRPEPIVKTRTVTVRHEKSWRDFDQDGAREWITQQAQGFCGKYPTDQACHKKEP